MQSGTKLHAGRATPFFDERENLMPLTYYAGSQKPSSADISTVLALTVGNCTPNDLEVILDAINAKSITRAAPSSQTVIGSLGLP